MCQIHALDMKPYNNPGPYKHRASGFALFIVMLVTLGSANGQELPSLNAFKYAIVQTLTYENNQVDKYQISSNVRRHFTELGIEVVDENRYDWPKELADNPCLGFHCNITPDAKLLSKYKVAIQLIDCNHRTFYQKTGRGSGDTEAEAFFEATENAFRDIDRIKYAFEPRMAIAKNTATLPIVGKFINKKNSLLISIQPKNSAFQIKVLDHGSSGFTDGQVIGQATESTLGDDIFNLEWISELGKHYETVARLGKDGVLLIEQKDGSEKGQVVFIKINE